MAAILKLLPQYNTEQIGKQLGISTGVIGKAKDFVADYLFECGIDSLDDIILADMYEYREYVESLPLKRDQKKYYKNLLEQVTFSYLISKNPRLTGYCEGLLQDRAIRNKTEGFMLLFQVESEEDINYELRSEYQKYLTDTIAAKKVYDYVKGMDILKLESIRIKNEDNPLRVPELKYEGNKIFLLYHPSFELAMTFYYIRNKEELLFDFSIATSAVMKRQVFKMLNHVLETKENWHDRRERFIIPLKLFYHYCVRSGIGDIEQITEKEICGFRKSIDGKVGTKTDTYMQIVDNIRKFLFLEAKNTNWNANAWYLERFSFDDGRVNPAREIRRLTFGQIENEKNRELIKLYIKYQLGVSQKSSLQTIRGQYYDIISFSRYLDEIGKMLTDVNAEDMVSYIKWLNGKDVQPESFNTALISIGRFYGYLITQKVLVKMPIHFDYYFKKTFVRHNDRAVSGDMQLEILRALRYLPIQLRLMYLNLWCVGLRINEVCVIKGDAYCWDGTDAWLHIYQNKMKTEKYVPIPTVLYETMQKYISMNNIKGDEFVFKNKRGGAYDAGTFCKQMQKHLKEAGIEDYSFKSHDFRHTVGSSLYAHGASIEVIRDYLGHKESDMTRQYLDFMPDIIDTANEDYFSSKENVMAKSAKKNREKRKNEDISE